MHQYIKNNLHIAFILLVTVLGIVLGIATAHVKQAKIEHELRTRLAEQEKVMLELALITDRNGANETIEKIVADCPRRNEYDTMLINLATLSKKDLLIMQNLFESCGNFYSERKALMVAQFERELVYYSEMLSMLKTLTTKDVDAYHEETWKEIVQLEKERSQLLSDQKVLQGEIITALISGSSVRSSEIKKFLDDAQGINELLAVNDKTVDAKRATLAPK